MFTTVDADLACLYLNQLLSIHKAYPYRIGNGELVIKCEAAAHDFFLWDWHNFEQYKSGRLHHLGVLSYVAT